jgi:hypothetical protein
MSVKDSIKTEKTLQDPEKVLKSILNLRDEVWARRQRHNMTMAEFLGKLNSCLYSGYELDPEYRMDQEWSSDPIPPKTRSR